MKRIKRLIAFFLCFLMLLPTQGLTVLAETLPLSNEQIQTDKELSAEATGDAEAVKEDQTGETVKPDSTDGDTYIIYWNPGGRLPADLATASDAKPIATVSDATRSDATSSNARRGDDSADGRSPATPVKTLSKAIERAEELVEKEGIIPSDITIYAMSPMEIGDGELYVLNAGNIRIESWPGRAYVNDTIFYVNGGQLTLLNAFIQPGSAGREIDDTEIIYVRGGTLQFGQNVTVRGRIILDHRSEMEEVQWEEANLATASDAEVIPAEAIAEVTAKDELQVKKKLLKNVSKAEGEETFDITNYILDTDEDAIELVEDTMSESTWRTPMIELLEGFTGGDGQYLLDAWMDEGTENLELVKTLYADEESADEFLNYFELAETEDSSWLLEVETETTELASASNAVKAFALFSDTAEEGVLTKKTLLASRAGNGNVIYWNPGLGFTSGDDTVPAGNDSLYDGKEPFAPKKTWAEAVKAAKNGVVICMQTLNLGAADASDYLGRLGTGEFYLASEDAVTMSALRSWKSSTGPAIVVPAGEILILEKIAVEGIFDKGVEQMTRTIYVNKGDLVIKEHVSAEKGYIQVDAFANLKDHPIQVTSTDALFDGDLTVFFGDINKNIAYRYVDVVVPSGDLAASINTDEDKVAVGLALKDRVKLHISNRSTDYGGLSFFDWALRPDEGDDRGAIYAQPQNLELYTLYYYEAIFIDGVNGNDGYYGATCDYPVKTWARAKAIWQLEMQNSLDARIDAVDKTNLDARFPVPNVIYICDTVTVDSASEPEWSLETRYDYDGTTEITTKVASHIDSEDPEGAALRHNVPMPMIRVTGSGVLSIRDIPIYNTIDDTNSVTIEVADGGSLTLKGDTVLSGTRGASTNFVAKDLTLGAHVTVAGGSSFVMDTDWTGSIEKTEQGIVASGAGTTVVMNNGYIQNNNSYRADLYSTGSTLHKRGTGVVLSDKASFTMNGGTITGNKAYQFGAGVYLVDNDTTFVMNKGKISANNMPAANTAYNGSRLLTYGVGIYAGTGTTVQLGNGINPQEDVLIAENNAYYVYGVGLYSDGIVTINKASVSDNYAGGGALSSKICNYGIGMYLGPNSRLNMNQGLIDGNHGIFTGIGNAFGAGIYFADNANSHTITASTISDNEPGKEYWSDYDSENESRGGGIHMLGTTLTITDSTITGNRAVNGGGIYAYGTNNSSYKANLTINNTIIEDNEGVPYNSGTPYGRGGGIYYYGYGNLTLGDGTKILNNKAKIYAAGLYLQGIGSSYSHFYMRGSTPQSIVISGNKALSTMGGGFYQANGTLHAEHVLITGNEAGTAGGGIYATSSSYGYIRDVEIVGNKATDGAGMGIDSAYYYMQDCAITDNTATGRGGGLHLLGTSATLYLTETADGEFKLSDNHAAYGGGISLYRSSAFVMNIAGPIQNSADQQGSNFYLDGYGNFDILKGEFKQPVLSKQVDGVYNFYIDDTSTSTYYKYFDFKDLTIEKKTGTNPEAMFLNSGSSYLMALSAPADDTPGSLPIDLNKEVFKSGSVIIKPAGTSLTATLNRTILEPNSGLTGTVSIFKSYVPGLTNATENMAYFTGGKLPRRMDLGGFADASYPIKTNVILVGQGVYLSGTGDDINNHGTSPGDAVKTFEKAVAILEERINNKAIAEASLPEDEREGYAPFIYICGQVNILDNGSEFWELDYEDSLYTVTNQYYAAAEERYGEPVYDAQVRRFASFVKQPMIRVGDGTANIDFTMGRLIIDGMADSVVLSDQGSSSPVIYAYPKTHVTLNGDSTIRNNYYSALDIYGELTLTGEEGDLNQQLYNNQTESIVRLYASSKMSMLKEAKIISDSDTKRYTTTSYGVRIFGSNVSILMSGNSGIVQEPGSSLMNGYAIYNNSTSYVNTDVRMEQNAQIQLGQSSSGGIYLAGGNSSVDMSENANITVTENASTSYGLYLQNTSSVTMSDYANITAREGATISSNGIYVSNVSSVTMSDYANITGLTNSAIAQGVQVNSSSLLMTDYAKIAYGGNRRVHHYGVYLNGSTTTAPSVRMQDNTAITMTDTTTGSSYSYYGIFVGAGKSPAVELMNNAQIYARSDLKSNTYGIYASNGNITDPVISMNMETTGASDEAARISNMYCGVFIGSLVRASLSMGKEAEITGSTYGVWFQTGNSTAYSVDMLMKDNSTINNSTSGIHFYYNTVPIKIIMEDNAAIEQNQLGISEHLVSSSTNYSTSMLDIEMNDYSRISGNSQYGIRLSNASGNYLPATHYQRITLNDYAVIGGSTYYQSTDKTSGNAYSGIYANGPLELTMNNESKISGNGNSISNSTTAGGVFLTRTTGSYYKGGTAKITLNDTASICDNRGGGIYSASTNNETYPSPCEITLNGIKADLSLSSPTIKGNTDAVYAGSHTTLKLLGGAKVEISDNPYQTGSYVARAIDMYGNMELDGRSTVDGLIHLNNSIFPITMTHAVTNVSQKYDLHLVEGFAGQIVVQPDMVNVSDLTGASTQLPYFNLVSADGMAAGRPLRELTPNLVLSGENNVYLAGNGNDANNGNTPSTAVRTFKRAKELLQGAGYYTAGANIIICNQEVQVLADDTDWSFDPGAKVTNSSSNQTWQPLVIRHEDYKYVLISLPGTSSTSYASEVTFKNIIIDGGSAEGIELNTTSGSQLLTVGYGKRAALGEGAVLRNNKSKTTSAPSSGSTMGVYVSGGTLEIDGGTIQNMVRETTSYSGGYGYFSSAISVWGYTTAYPSRVLFKSGRIVDNEVNGPSLSNYNYIGTISVYSNYSPYVASLEMSGGLIENNKVLTSTTYSYNNPTCGGAIMNYNGNTTISGGIIRGNVGGYGSAIYHYSTSPTLSRMILSGGQITGNTINRTGQASTGMNSPIHISYYGMELEGGGTDIQDNIYLGQTYSAIKISDHIYQTGRLYRLYLNQGTSSSQFKKGSVVVEPDGSKVPSVTEYLPYFQVHSNPYVIEAGRTTNDAGNVSGVKENQCLILMKAVYLDSVNGKPGNNGLTPAQAVDTFSRAKIIGESTSHGSSQHYIIYVSGKAVNTAAETEWYLPQTAYMSRYTGFPIYDSNGNETVEIERAYYGPLVEPTGTLRFHDIEIYGRRSNDSTLSNGDSLVKILSGVDVTVEDGALFANNYNVGSYIAEDGLADFLDSMGGAFQVAAGGTLTIKGGSIVGNDATFGSGIYLHASTTDPTDFGHLYLSGTPSISDKVYLAGTDNTTAAYVQPDKTYTPATALFISVSNDYNTRPLISYTDGTTPGEDEMDYFTFDDAIQALYDIINNSTQPNILELNLRRVIYLDGQNGSDSAPHDGTTPEKAFKTLKRAFSEIGTSSGTNGVLIYIVDTVRIAGDTGEPANVQLMNIKIMENGASHYEGYYSDSDGGHVDIRGQVYFKRYSQPTGYNVSDPTYDGYSKGTLYDSMFYVGDGGKFTLNGIYVDGHSIGSDSIDPTLVAPGVVAQSPLITVKGSGELKSSRVEDVTNGVETATLLINNTNANQKTKVVGRLNDSDIIEGSGAGIELLDGGTCVLEYTEFSNLKLGTNVISGGTDVYTNGDLHFSKETVFTGTVFLEGFETEVTSPSTSRYLTVDVYGRPLKYDFQVLMRDPYMGREVVHYQVGISATKNDAAYYRLEERVKDFFYLDNKSVAEPHILVLQVPVSVYIDGINGVDDPDDRVAGSTPSTPVKTLKRAFDLLNTRGGNSIYVVGAIQIDANVQGSVQMTGTSYTGNDGTVNLGSTSKIKIIRYIQPDFAKADPLAAATAGYDVDDYTGVMLNVRDGANAKFTQNVYFDGHSEPKTDTDLPEGLFVSSTDNEAKAPMITVEKGGTLTLLSGLTLQDNNNTFDHEVDSDGQYGGAISNSGTTTVDGTLFDNNKAARGSVVYQDGTFTIVSAPEKLDHHANAFYLTTENTGTAASPVWGTDHVIQTAVAIPENQLFDVDMDNPVKGRDVVRFTNNTAYNPNADAEHNHFRLGSTVPQTLFLVEAESDPAVLELQNWEILKVEVPTDIYLVVTRRGTFDSTTKLLGVIGDSSAGIDLFTAPEYTIRNKGIYDAKVSVSGFENKTVEAGITADLMNLTANEVSATGNQDLYLAIKGLDDTSGGTGFGFAETSLRSYSESPIAAPLVLGILKTQTSGNFTFVGSVGDGFVDKYMDASFPIEGVTKEDVQKYMDGTDSGVVNASAKYLMKYKVEIVPSRRTP